MRRSWIIVLPSTLALLGLAPGCGESTAAEVDGGIQLICDDAGDCEQVVPCDEDAGDCEGAEATKCDPDDEECVEDPDVEVITVDCDDPANAIDAAACELLAKDEVPEGIEIIDTSAEPAFGGGGGEGEG